MKTKSMWALVTVTVLFATCLSGSALGAILNNDPLGQCLNLSGMQIPAQAIGLSVTPGVPSLPNKGAVVDSATFIHATDSGNTNGEYCKVLGHINPVDPNAPVINFRVNLPTSWNGKAFQPGGGGYDGNIPSTTGKATEGSGTAPLTLGYMTFADDSGHTAADSNDASFAMNEEAMLNFSYMHIKKAKDVAFAIAKARYGVWPRRLYFAGGSTGGREGLTAAMRFPADYDGVIADYPTANFLGLRLWGVFLAHALYDNNSAGWIAPTLVNTIAADAIANCDPLDGVVDGLVANIPACRAQSGALVTSLTCPTGSTTNCLTPPMIDQTLKVYHDGYTIPYTFANGITQYEGYNALESIVMQIGTDSTLYNPVKDGPNAHHVARADQFVKYFITKDPNFNLITLDAANPGVWQPRIQYVSSVIDATNPDLSKFMNKGGKILMMQGTEDPSVSPFANARLYRSIVTKMGQAKTDSFMRFYKAVGLAHGGGNYSPTWDNLATLDNWVDKGIAPPDAPIAYGNGAATKGRTMPLCRYPTWPQFVSGDYKVASSYTCVNLTGGLYLP